MIIDPKNLIVVSIPAGTDHRAAIFEPVAILDGSSSHKPLKKQFRIRFDPGELFPGVRRQDGGFVVATSNIKPMIVIGKGYDHQYEAWEKLLKRADRWNVPHDHLLTERPFEIAVREFSIPSIGRKFLTIHAVRIVGDFSSSDTVDQQAINLINIFGL